MTNFEMVKEFYRTFVHEPSENVIYDLADERIILGLKLIREEFNELVIALGNHDMVEIADGLGDLAYVVYHFAIEHGIDLDKVFAEIHRSNMTKLFPCEGEPSCPACIVANKCLDPGPRYNEYQKVLKGPNYDPPHLEQFL